MLQVAALAADPTQDAVAGDDADAAMWVAVSSLRSMPSMLPYTSRLPGSVSVLAKISLRSPRKNVFLLSKYTFTGSKYSKKNSIWFKKKNHWYQATV